ncbi:hypothetical protein LCGC14_2824520 [marine sediment metagenome]|uniref:Uncharacterized protein n=1 Tax=marine sediment metagenome TaxID=412755 RepID=A0A0F9B739_9ZZZZ
MEEKQLVAVMPEQKESLKLSKMSKGYQWEIKIFIEDDKSVIQRLEGLDRDLKRIYIGED